MAINSRLHTSVGNRIEQERKRAMFSQEQLSNQLTISRSTLANIENGRHQCSLNTLYEIASALKIEIALLLPTVEEIHNTVNNKTTIEYLVKSQKITKTDAMKLEKYLNRK